MNRKVVTILLAVILSFNSTHQSCQAAKIVWHSVPQSTVVLSRDDDYTIHTNTSYSVTASDFYCVGSVNVLGGYDNLRSIETSKDGKSILFSTADLQSTLRLEIVWKPLPEHEKQCSEFKVTRTYYVTQNTTLNLYVDTSKVKGYVDNNDMQLTVFVGRKVKVTPMHALSEVYGKPQGIKWGLSKSNYVKGVKFSNGKLIFVAKKIGKFNVHFKYGDTKASLTVKIIKRPSKKKSR